MVLQMTMKTLDCSQRNEAADLRMLVELWLLAFVVSPADYINATCVACCKPDVYI